MKFSKTNLKEQKQMKFSKTNLKQIIKEELKKVLREQYDQPMGNITAPGKPSELGWFMVNPKTGDFQATVKSPIGDTDFVLRGKLDEDIMFELEDIMSGTLIP
jgi:hypothetical protein